MTNKVNNLTAVTQLSNLSLKVFSEQLGTEVVKYEDKMLIFGKNYISCAPSVVNFHVISPIDSMDCLMPGW